MGELRFDGPAEPIPDPDECEVFAKELRENMGEWALIGKTNSPGTARQRAYMIRMGGQRGFGPPKAFEAQSRTIFGEFRVYARYVGGEHDSRGGDRRR